MKSLTVINYIFVLITFVFAKKVVIRNYKPNWDSLDKRPLPKWYDDAKIGIFIHWGVFSVPSFGSEWFWMEWKGRNVSEYTQYMTKNYPADFSYQEFAKDFTAEFFEPDQWAELFKKSGARYVVLTSKHHEGFTLWPSKYSFSWNAKDIGPHRDLIGDLSKAVRKLNLHFGLYHSLYEWFNPMYLADKASKYNKTVFVDEKVIPEMVELVENYLPEVIWSDGDWDANDTYWKSTEFLAWLYNESPVKDTVVVNDRWGRGIGCHHGDFFSCKDRYNPGVLQQHKWENAMTLDKESWGFRRNANLSDYLTINQLLATLAETISCGGNLLINVGPTKDGIIAPIFQDRLLNLGNWLSVNGEAIYESKPWKVQNDSLSNVWYTTRNGSIFAVALSWPKSDVLKLGSAFELFQTNDVKVNLLGYPNKLKWNTSSRIVNVKFPDRSDVRTDWAFVVKITPNSQNVQLI